MNINSRGFLVQFKEIYQVFTSKLLHHFPGGGCFNTFLRIYRNTRVFAVSIHPALAMFFFCIKGVGTQSTQFGCAPECSFQEALPNDPELFGIDGFLDFRWKPMGLKIVNQIKKSLRKVFFFPNLQPQKIASAHLFPFQSATTSR